jgi:very-short-patch-repair endonuclease
VINPSPPAPPPQRGEGGRPERVSQESPSPLAGEGLGRGAEPPTRKALLERAKRMRANPTEAEQRLWSILRAKRLSGFKFRRQLIIEPYIVDFTCLEQRLIVEADGSQHADDPGDLRRDAFLQRQGFRVLRFWNNDILGGSEAVADAIYAALSVPHPPTAARRAPPSPVKGEGFGVQHA